MSRDHYKKDLLTQRQLDVLTLVAQGLSSKQVAVAINVHPATVRHHCSQATARLHAKSTSHAVIIALSRGLITLPE